MSTLAQRANSVCELCGSTDDLAPHLVSPRTGESDADFIYACGNCRTQIDEVNTPDPNHWRCLNDSMWSEVPAVQVVAYRMLHRLRSEGWPAELLDMLYLDEATKNWALRGIPDEDAAQHVDANGAPLQTGDSVTLIKDLKVKGANFTAKRGTKVKNISLVADNPGQIEGKVESQRIVILTEFVRKA